MSIRAIAEGQESLDLFVPLEDGLRSPKRLVMEFIMLDLRRRVDAGRALLMDVELRKPDGVLLREGPAV